MGWNGMEENDTGWDEVGPATAACLSKYISASSSVQDLGWSPCGRLWVMPILYCEWCLTHFSAPHLTLQSRSHLQAAKLCLALHEEQQQHSVPRAEGHKACTIPSHLLMRVQENIKKKSLKKNDNSYQLEKTQHWFCLEGWALQKFITFCQQDLNSSYNKVTGFIAVCLMHCVWEPLVPFHIGFTSAGSSQKSSPLLSTPGIRASRSLNLRAHWYRHTDTAKAKHLPWLQRLQDRCFAGTSQCVMWWVPNSGTKCHKNRCRWWVREIKEWEETENTRQRGKERKIRKQSQIIEHSI